jgi:hypothetical protein
MIIKRAFYWQIYINCQIPFWLSWTFWGHEAPQEAKWQTWVVKILNPIALADQYPSSKVVSNRTIMMHSPVS